MLSSGSELLHDSTRKQICRKLEFRLGDSVQIFPDDKEKLLLLPESVTARCFGKPESMQEFGIWKAEVTNFNKIVDQYRPWAVLLNH